MKILTAEFKLAAVAFDQCPATQAPEIALLGRSNVGKSTLLNALCGRRALARVSKTPGRTRALNFFEVTVKSGSKSLDLSVCDLPGYGFAQVSKAERSRWRALIQEYLAKRINLKVAVALIDAEVGPTSADFALLDFLLSHPPRVVVVATKFDRLTATRQSRRVQELESELSLPPGAVIGCSGTTKQGIDELWSAMLTGCV